MLKQKEKIDKSIKCWYSKICIFYIWYIPACNIECFRHKLYILANRNGKCNRVQKNANVYSAKLQSNEIVASSPIVRYTIKGISSIDTPHVTYNGVDYELHNMDGDVYESERLNLVSTSTRIILHIGEFKQTDNLSINTGVLEDDLFGF